MRRVNHNQTGAVSIFVVIFSALLVTVVTISFLQIMLRDQQQASVTDLSTSAYDSAQAGVEDAKRALLAYQRACTSGLSVAGKSCADLRSDFSSLDCDTLAKANIAGNVDAAETMVQQHTGDAAMDQAYTCVNILLDTPDYLGQLEADTSRIVPLRGKKSFNKIKLSWFTAKDYTNLHLPFVSSQSLPLAESWSPHGKQRPPIMRTQLIQTTNSMTLDSFEDSSGSATLFLYPQPSGGDTANFGLDPRDPIGQKNLQNIRCNAGSSYVCSATIDVGLSGASVPAYQLALLRLTSMYNSTHFKVELFSGTTRVDMDGVQPEVDSTGRANDLFRRVKSRVELADTGFPYPEAALYSSKNICKAIRVTDKANVGYSDSGCKSNQP